MLENYLIRGFVIGIVFGVPAGVVGVLSIQRVLAQGALAGFMTGIGSSVADVLYACVGVFGITIISDFLLKHQSMICMAGCLLVIAIGIRTFRKKGEKKQLAQQVSDGLGGCQTAQPRPMISCFFSSFAIAITNPATILSFMVVFSMFRISGHESVGENIQLVFGIFCGTCVWWLAIAVIVSLLRNRMTDNLYMKLNRIFGTLMILFGMVIGVRGCLFS